MKLGTTDISKIMVGSSEVTSGYLGTVSIFSSGPQPLDPTEPFYIENPNSSAITVTFLRTTSSAPSPSIQYSSDNTTWTTLGSTSTSGLTISVPANSKMYFRSNTTGWTYRTNYNIISASSSFNIGGNIMSLLYGSGFTGNETTFPSAGNGIIYLSHLFEGSTYLKDASKLLMPATTLVNNCYDNMFADCSALTTAPTLPATTVLPFCYRNMFYNCRKLNYVKCLATTVQNKGTVSWLYNVASTGTFVKDSTMSSWTTGVDGIPSGWTIQNA